jgi:hypothetical protein
MLGSMLTVALAASLAVLLAGGAALPPPAPLAVVNVPDEPGAIVLPDDEPTLQAVAGDLDGDGARELVRLVGSGGGPLWIEAWGAGADGWALAAPRAVAVPAQGGQAELAYAGRPVRLLVRRVNGRDRVTLVRQPDFSEPEDPRDCCLLLDDLVPSGNAIELVRVAEPASVADTVHAIDLDGDGTDELLATYSLEPLNVATTPVEGRVFRWTDGRFASPTVTELEVGAGSTAFVLGDSDGVPGEEAGYISNAANNHLFRISLRSGDELVSEDSGIVATGALGVPLGILRRGLAVLNPSMGVGVMAWPRGRSPFGQLFTRPIENARLIVVVVAAGEPRLLVHRTDPGALHALSLPRLEPLPDGPIEPSQASEALARGGLEPYVGPLPGGGLNGEPAAIVAGHMLPGPRRGLVSPTGALPGATPVGLIGPDRGWLALHQGAFGPVPIDPAGGRLDPPDLQSGAIVTIAPVALAGASEADGGAYDPVTTGVAVGDGVTGVSRDGLVAEVRAPPGSRVYLPDPGLSGSLAVRVVDDGARDVIVKPPADATANMLVDVTVVIVTPAGHAYAKAWSLLLLEEPPTLSARTETAFGSSSARLTGRTAPHADVEVEGAAVAVDADGRFTTAVDLPPWPSEVTVTARDPLGQETTLVVSGVGLFDYRGLPWVPIVLLLVGAAALALILRVPKARVEPRPAGDDAGLEELDPAERL